MNKKICLLLLVTVQFIALLDFSITLIPLPKIQKDLAFSDGGIQWVVNAYGIAIAGFLLLGGRAADLFGKKKIFILGNSIFLVASLIGGFAPNAVVLIIARAFQGIGAALFSPAALSLLLTIFIQPKEKVNALGVWTAVAATGYVAGLLLGGIITDSLGWRWVLWLNVPIGAGILLFSRYLPAGLPDKGQETNNLDIKGAILILISISTFIYAFANSEHVGLIHWQTALYLVLSLIFLYWFVLTEKKATNPIMPLSLFAHNATNGANIASLFANIGLGPSFVIIAMYLQSILGYSSTQTGLSLLPMAVIFSLSSAYFGTFLIQKYGTKSIVIGGMLVFGLGLLSLYYSLLNFDSYFVSILPGTLIAGFGYGIAFPAWTAAGLDYVPSKDHGLAGGLLTTTQEVGAAVGLALGVAVSIIIAKEGGELYEGYALALLVSAIAVLIGALLSFLIIPKYKSV